MLFRDQRTQKKLRAARPARVAPSHTVVNHHHPIADAARVSPFSLYGGRPARAALSHTPKIPHRPDEENHLLGQVAQNFLHRRDEDKHLLKPGRLELHFRDEAALPCRATSLSQKASLNCRPNSIEANLQTSTPDVPLDHQNCRGPPSPNAARGHGPSSVGRRKCVARC